MDPKIKDRVHTGSLSATGVFGRRCFQLDKAVDELTGNRQLVELVQPATLASKADLEKVVHDLYERVNVLSARNELKPGDDERKNLEKAFADLSKDLAAMKETVASTHREAPSGKPEDSPFQSMGGILSRLEPPKGMSRLHFNLVALDPNEMSYLGAYGRDMGLDVRTAKLNEKMGLNDYWRGKVQELQAINDLLLFADAALYGDGSTEYAQRSESRKVRIQGLKIYKDWKAITEEFKRANTALDTQTAGEGLEWVPTLYSSQLIGMIQAQLVLANLFQRTTMPSATYIYPVMGADMIAYKTPESTEEGATAIVSKTFVTNKMTLVAIKLATRIMSSSEFVEDSIVAVAPIVNLQVAKALARGIDDAIDNGDTTATHQDADVTASTDRRKSWDGLRKIALAGDAKQDASAAQLTIAQLMDLKGQMGQYGALPSQGVWICGFQSILQLMQTKDSSDANVFLTLEKYGSNATAITGELGRVAGSPAVLSEFNRENTNTSGVVSGVSNDDVKGYILYANRESFTLGERRAVTINRSSERYIETDQLVFVGTWRGDFKCYYDTSTENTVGIIYNTK